MTIRLKPASDVAAAWHDDSVGLFDTFHDALALELGVPVVVTDAQLEGDPRVTGNNDCLVTVREGCQSIDTKDDCESSVDGGQDGPEDLKVHGEPCVWCGGQECTSKGENTCAPRDWLMRGKGIAFDNFVTKDWTVAWCWGETADFKIEFAVEPRDDIQEERVLHNIQVMSHTVVSNHITDAFEDNVDWTAGIQVVHLENSVVSTDEIPPSARYLVSTMQVSVTPVAAITEAYYDENRGLFATFQETLTRELGVDVTIGEIKFVSNPFQEGEADCLDQQPEGCPFIADEDLCEARVDGRTMTEYRGLKIQGQPCVWCNEGPCTSNGPSRCEPEDYLLNGEGVNFTYFLAKGSYTVAWCWKHSANFEIVYSMIPGTFAKEMDLREKIAMMPADVVSEDFSDFFEQDVQWSSPIRVLRLTNLVRSSRTQPTTTTTTTTTRPSKPPVHEFVVATMQLVLGPASDVSNAWERDGSEIFKFFADVLSKELHSEVEVTEVALKNRLQNSELSDCLMPAGGGCASLQEESLCTKSFDGSDVADMEGVSVHGAACAWCKGLPCSETQPALCLPYNFLTASGVTDFVKAWCWERDAHFEITYVMAPTSDIHAEKIISRVAEMSHEVVSQHLSKDEALGLHVVSLSNVVRETDVRPSAVQRVVVT